MLEIRKKKTSINYLRKGKSAMATQHDELGGSVIERVWNCPGSLELIKQAPKSKPSFYSAQGTVAHAIAANRILNRNFTPIGTVIKQDGFDVTFDDEMAEHVMTYVSYVRGIETKYRVKPKVEVPVLIPNPYRDPLKGTADVAFVLPYIKLVVIDFKYGAGTKVNVEWNKQLLFYALGVFLGLSKEEQDLIPKIEIVVVQPRGVGSGIVSYAITRRELLNWRTELLLAVKEVVQDKSTKIHAGSWCKFCPALAICPAQRQQAKELTRLAFDGVSDDIAPVSLPSIEKLPLKVLVQVLDKADDMRNWLNACEQYALGLAEQNKEVPSYCLVPKIGNRRWKDTKGAEKHLLDILEPYECYTEPKLISPTQAIELIKRQNIDTNLSVLIERPDKGYSLVKADGNRKSVKPVNAFAGVKD
jgi:hypothetical protein